MSIIELSFRNESIFMTKGDITGFTKEEWFLKTIMESDCFLEETNKLEINEDKNTAMSLIETLRYNRLIIYPRVSMDYLLLLAEKWCIPDNIIEMIKERMEQNINVNNIDKTIHETPIFDPIDNIIFRCYVCNTGFKMIENTKQSCTIHGGFSHAHSTFECCGGRAGSTPCKIGYHVLNYSDREIYFKHKKLSIK